MIAGNRPYTAERLAVSIEIAAERLLRGTLSVRAAEVLCKLYELRMKLRVEG